MVWVNAALVNRAEHLIWSAINFNEQFGKSKNREPILNLKKGLNGLLEFMLGMEPPKGIAEKLATLSGGIQTLLDILDTYKEGFNDRNYNDAKQRIRQQLQQFMMAFNHFLEHPSKPKQASLQQSNQTAIDPVAQLAKAFKENSTQDKDVISSNTTTSLELADIEIDYATTTPVDLTDRIMELKRFLERLNHAPAEKKGWFSTISSTFFHFPKTCTAGLGAMSFAGLYRLLTFLSDQYGEEMNGWIDTKDTGISHQTLIAGATFLAGFSMCGAALVKRCIDKRKLNEEGEHLLALDRGERIHDSVERKRKSSSR